MSAAFLPVLLALCAGPTQTSTPTPAGVELVTLAPGQALYSLWGHTAVRVLERRPPRELAYNFGSIDFSGAVLARMLSGEVQASVDVSPYFRMAQAYQAERRSIIRQALRLSPAQAEALVADLRHRVGSGQQPYRYHHFDQNCSTQVADALDEAMQGSLSSQFQGPAETTIRQLALDPLRAQALLYVTVDVLLSAEVDQPISRWQTRFLPSELSKLLADAKRTDGTPLAAPQTIDYRGADAESREQWTWPWVKVYLLFVLPLLFASLRFARPTALIWTAVCGSLGLLLSVAWLGTGYSFLHHNWNLLVLPPTHLLAFMALIRARWRGRPGLRRALIAYAAVHVLIVFALFAATALDALPQAIEPVLGLALGPACMLLFRLSRRPLS